MSNPSKLSQIINSHSNKLNSLLDQLDGKLQETISKMDPKQRLALYEKLSTLYGIKLDNMIKDKK